MTVTILPPPPPTATISISPSTAYIGTQQFTVTWSSTNAANCTETGDGQSSGAVWGIGALSASGSQVMGPANEPGKFTFGISCDSIDSSLSGASANATLTVVQPTVTLLTNQSSVTQGQSFTLTWSSVGANACLASGGGAGSSSWSGSLAPSGSATEDAASVGTFTYTITCGTDFPGQANVAVKVVAAAAASAPSSGGGGGAWGLLELGMLGVLLVRETLPPRRRRLPAPLRV